MVKHYKTLSRKENLCKSLSFLGVIDNLSDQYLDKLTILLTLFMFVHLNISVLTLFLVFP